MLQRIKLLRRHNGRKRGSTVEVDHMRAARMIEDGVGVCADTTNADGASAGPPARKD